MMIAYMLSLGSIFRIYGISFHGYANDTFFYLQNSVINSIQSLLACPDDIKAWMF